MKKQLVFISYRRDDEGYTAGFINAELERHFGTEQIFMDVSDIRIGDNWIEQIESNLGQATILIAIIGRNWLKLQDKYFRRRLDNEDDWVRKEIQYAIKKRYWFCLF